MGRPRNCAELAAKPKPVAEQEERLDNEVPLGWAAGGEEQLQEEGEQPDLSVERRAGKRPSSKPSSPRSAKAAHKGVKPGGGSKGGQGKGKENKGAKGKGVRDAEGKGVDGAGARARRSNRT
ncbi:hypothetical protein PLESTM_001565900 [Pleodorina starrii]|nr:hypothetical protein PLESTM_001565900 [Pleodorina starrii]